MAKSAVGMGLLAFTNNTNLPHILHPRLCRIPLRIIHQYFGHATITAYTPPDNKGLSFWVSL